MNNSASYHSVCISRNDQINFPLQEQIQHGESGQGYVLRMAALNSLPGLGAVKKLLGTPTSTLDGQQASIISKWFGANPERLRHALGTIAYTNSGPTIYGGHKLTKATFLNRTQPRVCPLCIQDTGLCKLVWDFSLVTTCDKHRISLVDYCSSCGKRIQWERPTVETCRCYSPLSQSQNFHVPHEVEFEFAHWVRLQIQNKWFDEALRTEAYELLAELKPTSSLMQLLWPLSLDAGLLVAVALSTASGQSLDMSEISRRRLDSLQRAQVALMMANELATLLKKQDYARLHLKSASAVVGLIANCTSHEFSATDRGFAQSLLATVIGQYKAQRWSSSMPQLSQLTLFDLSEK
jgi:TniQ